MWKPFKCRLFGEHDYQMRREPGALFLECTRCGHRSPGWDLPERRLAHTNGSLRLLFAESGEADRTARDADGTGAAMWVTMIEAGKPRLTLGRED